MKSALNKIKRDPYLSLQEKQYQNQFGNKESSFSEMEKAADASNKDPLSVTKEKITGGKDLVTKQMKIMKAADRYKLGWATVNEYEEADYALDSDNERRLSRSEERTERAMTKARRARSRRERTQPG